MSTLQIQIERSTEIGGKQWQANVVIGEKTYPMFVGSNTLGEMLQDGFVQKIDAPDQIESSFNSPEFTSDVFNLREQISEEKAVEKTVVDEQKSSDAGSTTGSDEPTTDLGGPL